MILRGRMIASRTALRQGIGNQDGEPLSSSTIDIWSKRTARMVINDWYLADHYHEDSGEGRGLLFRWSVARLRWQRPLAADRLWTSRNFINSPRTGQWSNPRGVRVGLCAIPVDNISVSEVKRVTLDAGSQLDRFQSTYKTIHAALVRPKADRRHRPEETAGEQVEGTPNAAGC